MMASLVKRRWFWAFLALATVAAVVWQVYFAGDPMVRGYSAISHGWDSAMRKYHQTLQNAKTGEEREAIQATRAPDPAAYAKRCLALADAHPGTWAEVAALTWATSHAPNTEEGKKAHARLAGGVVATADLYDLARGFISVRGASKEPLRDLTPAVVDRVKKEPGHEEAAWLLTWVCTTYFGDTALEAAPPAFTEAADLIVARHADSPEITNFCECFGTGHGTPSWAGPFEKHLQAILKKNDNRRVRRAAMFALASVVQSAGEARQAEAEALYKGFLGEYDGEDDVEKWLREAAAREMDEMKTRGVGKPAAEIDGTDLDGRPMKLSEHRGKVVLLSFWATWCFPCMKLVPHERELVEKLSGKPFVLLGVNEDSDEAAIKKAVAKHKINWRSFHDKRPGRRAVSQEWKVIGPPTLYLIDDKGIVRKRWVGAPPAEELGREVDQLVAQVSKGG
jgi:thiol-disulfide isomerase/thioredoxin